MVPSLSGGDFSFLEEFDIDFEFDAPRFYDFSRPELDSETEENEFWFESAGNYPPSPFSPKFTWKLEPLKQIINTSLETKPVDTGLNRKDKYNGFIYYNQTVKDVSKTKPKSKTKSSRSSTLTRPTVSLLARQNKPLDVYSVQLLTRCQRSLAKFGANLSPILVSKLQNQDTKRQKLEAKVAQVNSNRRSKLTVPKEPNLRTAERSERHRSKVNSETEQNINLEPSSASIPKSNTLRSQNLKAFGSRTTLRAKERSSSAKVDASQGNEATNSRTLVHSLLKLHQSTFLARFDFPKNILTHILCRLKPIDSSKGRRDKGNHSRKIHCQVYESNICTPNSKGLELCRKFNSQKVTGTLIIA
ncbi:Cell cycle regulated microtubule associated protein [Raphanus sativus]|nr:Cell cycle regulated microtubule associated protein [Raphanus sativus]